MRSLGIYNLKNLVCLSTQTIISNNLSYSLVLQKIAHNCVFMHHDQHGSAQAGSARIGTAFKACHMHLCTYLQVTVLLIFVPLSKSYRTVILHIYSDMRTPTSRNVVPGLDVIRVYTSNRRAAPSPPRGPLGGERGCGSFGTRPFVAR